MKFIIFLITLISFLNAEQYTFLLNKYDKELELESQIILNIANASIKNDIKLFIPEISDMEKGVYSKNFTLTNNCVDANFIFVKREVNLNFYCKNYENKIFFTNNYEKLLNDNRYIGAFFWNKSRPNITFIKARLEKEKIKLSKDYDKFVEDF
ncbi:hypothetical protein AVENP_1666 [Arcobacter venerupis]|uniref:Uncharacterized protein n=1 Tax=Arcobacter venerupis TaxID=1054033 RepID=A0AAE7BBH9_9BACT|nr:hypothetical protein [Arcobacter venerupis]QKF67212.1 hypothetical protein AVENP_1666 [Arcobacter venerupis]RWS48423.1 hypothetical protein CKA56_14375 [Arcobacter venerupis]